MLRGHVFSVESGRRQLEAILHPLVRDRIGSISRMSSKGSVVIAEVPLLFESGWESDFDRVVCVVASLETAISRIVQRDLVSREDAERIVAAQMDLAEKARRSDWTIDNDGDPAQFERQLAKVAHMITELSVRL
jgi:dephospho-CoA kinase